MTILWHSRSAQTVARRGVLLAVIASGLSSPTNPDAIDGTSHRALKIENDSARVRRDVERAIKQFQNEWRRIWQESIIARNGGWMNMNMVRTDEFYGVNTPNVLRLYALTCYVEFGTFGAVYQQRRTGRAWYNQSPSSVASRSSEAVNLRLPTRITAKGNDTAVCPRWIPDELGVTVDEGEHIDLAVGLNKREQVRDMRSALIARLDAAATAYPGDRWLSGQRVRFLLDNQNWGRALEVAESCAGTESWCKALEGLVHSKTGNLTAAEQAFDQSLDALRVTYNEVAGTSCADTTARPLFPQAIRLSQLDTSCEKWTDHTRNTWWLSKPLWSESGNVRMVEHYARRTLLTLRMAIDEDERYIWRKSAAGDALQEVIIRYGWPTHTWWGGWDVDRYVADYAERLRSQAEYPYTAKEYAPDRVPLIPDFKAVASPFDALDEHWQWERPSNVPQERWFPSEHMASPIRLARLPAGQSVLLRRDSALVYGLVIDDPVHDLDGTIGSLPKARLVSSRGPGDFRTIADTLLPFDQSLRITASLPAEPTVLSVEVLHRSSSEPAHRRRFGLRPPSSLAQMSDTELALSDPAFLLLPQFGASPSADPDSAIARLVGSLRLPRNVPLALYWESYGFRAGDSVEVQLRILRNDGSALRSAGAFFGVSDALRDSVSIRWREPDPGRNARELSALKPTVARAVSVDIRTLEPGRYVFSVQMTRSDGSSARGERQVEIVR